MRELGMRQGRSPEKASPPGKKGEGMPGPAGFGGTSCGIAGGCLRAILVAARFGGGAFICVADDVPGVLGEDVCGDKFIGGKL
jgi:hypothetical protein